ncbi:MAG: tRNA pseudouridine(55) synthase TruB [Chlamydiia bacterium]|nr:tRNA pseudouridine(55) synthase TruB [Chlamydiia bacterium]
MQKTSGLLPVDKRAGCTSFDIVTQLRRVTGERTIGHAGTLDPFATGVMILLIGPLFTKQSMAYTGLDKEYEAELTLGIATDTYDLEGKVTNQSSHLPTLKSVEEKLLLFQGNIFQIPPMFSAKKIQGKKLYEYARQGVLVQRAPIEVTLHCKIVSYQFPKLLLHIRCSKGTYIRSLANDLGIALGSFAHLTKLRRLKVGPLAVETCIPQDEINLQTIPNFLKQTL